MSGFQVDLTALSAAATGILATMDHTATTKVSGLAPSADSCGDTEFAASLGQFCRRWQVGVTNLEADAQAVAQRLQYCVSAYTQTDEATRAGFRGMISRPTGPDPAAS